MDVNKTPEMHGEAGVQPMVVVSTEPVDIVNPLAEASPESPTVTFESWRLGWLLVAILSIGAYFGVHYLNSYLPFSVNPYLLQPVLWLTPAVVAVNLLRSKRRLILHTALDLILLAVAIAIITIALSFLVGIFTGLGHSPYPHNPMSLLRNFWYIGAILVGREFARWYLVTALHRWGELPSIGLTWLIFWLTSIPLGLYSRLGSSETAFEFMGTLLFPAAATQLFATYLALRGGPLVSIAYLGVLTGFEWFSPVLPDLAWPMVALIGVLVPLAGLKLLESDGRIETGDIEDGDVEGGIAWGWLAGAFLLVAMIWFNTGVFGVLPAVVHGSSMLPTMKTGDIAITRQVHPDELEIGDVIRFKLFGRVVLHRIVEITYDADGRMVVIAQGDNNAGADPPVPVEDVEGRLVRHVPHAGMPAVYLKQGVSWLTGW